MILDHSYGKEKEIRRLISRSCLHMDSLDVSAWMKYKYDPSGMFCAVEDKKIVACLQTRQTARAVAYGRNEQPQLVGFIINEINRDGTAQESSGRTVYPHLDELPRKYLRKRTVLRQLDKNLLVINMFHRNDF